MIDLISDTVTKPSPEMRKAMASSEVGDSQKCEDPSVNALQDAVCELLNKDAALYLPSSTMANQIAIKVHTKPGDEIITDRMAHTVNYEGGAPAFLSGVMFRLIDAAGGIFSEEDVLASIRPDDPHAPRSRMVLVENTHNLGGGTVWPMGKLMAVRDIANQSGLAVHMDGSRLMNAVVASGIGAREWAAQTDSMTLCFSKGMGAPVGATLAGSKDFIKEARRVQQVLGGAMRQAGIIAAGALYGLQHNVDRLAEDHANAKLLAERIADIETIDIDPSQFKTNIIFFEVSRTGMSATAFVNKLNNRGVRMSAMGERIRAVTHMDVSREDILKAADAVHGVISE